MNCEVSPERVCVVLPNMIGPPDAVNVTVEHEFVRPTPTLPHDTEDTLAVPVQLLVSVVV